MLGLNKHKADSTANTLIDETLRKTEFLFRCGGINIKSGKNVYPNLKARAIFFFNVLWMGYEVAGGYYYCVDGLQKGKDFLSVTFSAPCITYATLSQFKGFSLLFNEQKVHNLIDKLKELELKDNARKRSDDKDDIVKKERDFLHIVINGNNWLYLVLLILFATTPMIMMLVKYLNSGEIELMVPFLVVYPFDAFQLTVWPFVYLHQVWAEIIVCLYLYGADVFFYICCTYIRIQFKLLQHTIQNLIPVDENRFLNDDDFKEKFRDIVIWHQELIECTEMLEQINSKSNLMNFMISSLVICLSGFNVTMVKEIAVLMIFVNFLSMSLFQVFCLCYFADLLMNSSMDIRDAVYQSLWYNAEPKVEKQLLTMQIRASKPCQMTAFGFTDVNLNLFMRVLSTSWSYFALLRTLYD